LDFSAADQTCGFHHFTGGIAFNGRLGVFNFANDDGRQFYGDWVAFVESYFAYVFHAVNDEFQRVADVVGFDFVLVEFFVHEDVHWVGKVAVSTVFAGQNHDVEFVVGFVNGFRSGTGQQVFQFHADFGGRATAFDVFGFLNNHRVVADHEYVAGAQFLCCFHCSFPIKSVVIKRTILAYFFVL